MAYAVQLTIGTGNKITLNYQSQEVSIALTYQLEQGDTDVLQVVQDKAAEVAHAHRAAWQTMRDVKVEGKDTKRQSPAGPPIEGDAVPESASTADNSVEPGLAEQTDVAINNVVMDVEGATDGQLSALRALLAHIGMSDEEITEHLKNQFSCSDFEELTRQQAGSWLLQLQRHEREQAQQRRVQAAYSNGKSDSS